MHFGETPFTFALWEHMLYFNIFDTPLHFCTISRESAESAIVKYSSQKIIMNDLFSYWRGLGVWMISGLNSREKMAHRTNSIQWRVTLPPAICLVLGIPITHILSICFKEDSAKRRVNGWLFCDHRFPITKWTPIPNHSCAGINH